MSALRHFILTRFNMGLYRSPTTSRRQKKAPVSEWAAHRLDLFSRYTVPSVRAQTVQDFTWLIGVDYRIFPTPCTRLYKECAFWGAPDCLAQLKAVLDGMNYELIPCDTNGSSLGPFRAYLLGLIAAPCRLLTTMLDSDDALHRRHLESVRGVAMQHQHALVDFHDGYILDEGTSRVASVRKPRYHFLSLIEEACRGNVQTVVADVHCRMAVLAPNVSVDSEPLWLEVCHDYNVGNVFPAGRPTQPFDSVSGLFGVKV